MTDRKWRIVIDVNETQGTLRFEVETGEGPTVQETLQALQFAANQVNSMKVPVTQPEPET